MNNPVPMPDQSNSKSHNTCVSVRLSNAFSSNDWKYDAIPTVTTIMAGAENVNVPSFAVAIVTWTSESALAVNANKANAITAPASFMGAPGRLSRQLQCQSRGVLQFNGLPVH